MLQQLIIQFSFNYLSTGRLCGEAKTKENFKYLALKVVVVTYERGGRL